MEHFFRNVRGLGNVAVSRHAQARIAEDGIHPDAFTRECNERGWSSPNSNPGGAGSARWSRPSRKADMLAASAFGMGFRTGKASAGGALGAPDNALIRMR